MQSEVRRLFVFVIVPAVRMPFALSTYDFPKIIFVRLIFVDCPFASIRYLPSATLL